MRKRMVSAVLAAVLAVGTNGIAPSASDKAYAMTSTVVDPALLKKLGSMLDTDSQQVILTYQNKPAQSDLDALKALGIGTGVVLNELPMIITTMTKVQLNALLGVQLPNLLSVYGDKELQYFVDKSTAQIGAAKNRATPSMGFSGKGVGVAVLDSGIDGTHPDLQFGTRTVQNVKIVGHGLLSDFIEPAYAENVPDTDNAGGHGTHCAGIIGGDGTGSGGLYEGVAPEANLIGVSAGAAILITSALQGMDYVLQHQEEYNIQVLSNSWGTTGAYDPNDPINQASKLLHDRGVTVVFAAGNEGPSANTQNPYSVAPWVIGVAAGHKENGTLADFSSRGIRGDALVHPTITAPGVDIISAKAKQSVLSPLSAQTDAEMIPAEYLLNYTTMSGTSMATPQVAGVLALLEEANPTLTPEQSKNIIEQTATRMPGYESFEVGKGYLNAYAAIDMAQHMDRAYGAVVNQTFRSTYTGTVDAPPATEAAWSPAAPTTYTFEVRDNAQVTDLLVEWETLTNLPTVRLTAPDGTVTTENASELSAVYGTQISMEIPAPQKGTYKVEVLGLLGQPIGLPDTVHISYRTYYGSFSGMNDIAGHPYEAAIRTAVEKRLIDSANGTNFRPDAWINKGDLARWIASDFEIRQNLTRPVGYTDVTAELAPYVAAVTADGAPMRDIFWQGGGVIAPTSATAFGTNEKVDRGQVAMALVKSFGWEADAQQNRNTPTSFSDDSQIPADVRGYVVVATQKGLMEGYPDGTFRAGENMKRGAFAQSLVTAYNVFRAE